MLMLRVWGPHFEYHSFKLYHNSPLKTIFTFRRFYFSIDVTEQM